MPTAYHLYTITTLPRGPLRNGGPALPYDRRARESGERAHDTQPERRSVPEWRHPLQMQARLPDQAAISRPREGDGVQAVRDPVRVPGLRARRDACRKGPDVRRPHQG